MKNGDPRIARCQFCMKSGIIHHDHDHHSFHASNANSRMNSALGQLVHLRKSNSMSGHVPVLFMCCEYHFLDTIMNFLFLINSNSNHIDISS